MHHSDHSIPHLLLRAGPTPKRTKITLTRCDWDIKAPLVQSSKDAPHTLNHTTLFPLFPQTGLGDTRAWSFSIQYAGSNHHKWDYHITRSKISFSLIEPQPFTFTPTHGHEFHALAFHRHSTFVAPLVLSAL